MMNASTLLNRIREEVPKSDLARLREVTFAGITQFSTVDYPGMLSAVLYTQGCALRCRFCHNPEFWEFKSQTSVAPFDVFEFLVSRRGLLDAIVFSGGEPTWHTGLALWMKIARILEFKVGLHTSGIYPERLQELLPLCDWVAMDVKAPLDKYQKVMPASPNPIRLKRSIQLILRSRISYEFHTVYHPKLIDEEDLVGIARSLAALGVRHYRIREFEPGGCRDPLLCQGWPSSVTPSEKLRDKLQALRVQIT